MDTQSQPDVQERERVLEPAESNRAFAAIGRMLSELVEQTGLPEGEILNALLYSDELAAEVNRRLAGEMPKERLTEVEWKEREFRKQQREMAAVWQQMQDQAQDEKMCNIAGLANAAPGAIMPIWPGCKIPIENTPSISRFKDHMREMLENITK